MIRTRTAVLVLVALCALGAASFWAVMQEHSAVAQSYPITKIYQNVINDTMTDAASIPPLTTTRANYNAAIAFTAESSSVIDIQGMNKIALMVRCIPPRESVAADTGRNIRLAVQVRAYAWPFSSTQPADSVGMAVWTPLSSVQTSSAPDSLAGQELNGSSGIGTKVNWLTGVYPGEMVVAFNNPYSGRGGFVTQGAEFGNNCVWIPLYARSAGGFFAPYMSIRVRLLNGGYGAASLGASPAYHYKPRVQVSVVGIQ